MGLHRDVLKLMRCFEEAKREVSGQDTAWHQVEIEIVTRYLTWVTRLKEQYPTALQQDKELLELVTQETLNGKFHWMYQFVLTYRIGQKEILDYQIMHCKNVLTQLVTCEGDKTKFCDATLDLQRWSNTLTDYFFEDLNVNGDSDSNSNKS